MNILDRSSLRAKNGLPYFEIPEIEQLGWVRHAFLTRQGGVSVPPYDSFNVSDKNGDREDFVSENKNRIATAFHFEPRRLILLDQMQRDQILLMKEPIDTLPAPIGDRVGMSLRGSETTEAISQGIDISEIATLLLVARNDRMGISTQPLNKGA